MLTSIQDWGSLPDYSKQNQRLSWADFSEFYKNQNEWDYPVEDDEDKINHDDMFKNHGSRQSMDNLAEQMGAKWSYEVNNTENQNKNDNDNNNNNDKFDDNPFTSPNLPPKVTKMQRNSYSTLAQPSANIYQCFSPPINQENTDIVSITPYSAKSMQSIDSQGIDTNDDLNLSKDEQIKNLKLYIQEILNDKEALTLENTKLKNRISELRKTLNKAQQYRRRSSAAVQSLVNINNEMNNMKNEEKVHEEDDLSKNAKIQQQIQEAIAIFQIEWGVELDDELNNIESFQYESIPNDEQSIDLAVEDMVFDANKNMDFRTKFTDAHSDKNDEDEVETKETETEINETETEVTKGEFLDDPISDDEDALPDSFYTAGSTHHYPTPGGGEFITNAGDEEKGNVINVDLNQQQNGNNEKIKEMELKLETLSEKTLNLMERIEDLTNKNQELEMSKMTLITTFSNEMNEYRQTVRKLSKQNNILLAKVRNK